MRIRRLLCTVAAAALAVAAQAGTVVAQDEARVWHVQGIPGISIDVCVGGEEVYSNLRYTRWRLSTIPAGSKRVPGVPVRPARVPRAQVHR